MSNQNDIFEAMITSINVINKRSDERHAELMEAFKCILEAIDKVISEIEVSNG